MDHTHRKRKNSKLGMPKRCNTVVHQWASENDEVINGASEVSSVGKSELEVMNAVATTTKWNNDEQR